MARARRKRSLTKESPSVMTDQELLYLMDETTSNAMRDRIMAEIHARGLDTGCPFWEDH